ncbi:MULTISPECIES: hypothetical protein [unclassified Halomonas]|nr:MULTISPECIES: hypothetical protein [unclassified Halomonas]
MLLNRVCINNRPFYARGTRRIGAFKVQVVTERYRAGGYQA